MKLPLIRPLRFDRPADAIYIELVDALFSVIPPLVILVICLGAVGGAIIVKTGDLPILALSIAVLLVLMGRIWMVLQYRRAIAAHPLTLTSARQWEKHFAIGSLITAALVGAMGARSFMLPHTSVRLLMIGVLFAFGAGTLTRIVYRPQLALLNLLIVAIPSIVACLIVGGPVYWCLAFIMVVFLFGALETVHHLYATIVSQLVLKLRFAGLARSDPLTGLSNRLGLQEDLDRLIAAACRDGTNLAIHSLDLNNFKAANDHFGHPVGDALLQEVARRLARLKRESDLLVRLGGDEFVLVQTNVDAREQALALVNRIISEISATYVINGHLITLGTSVGIALMPSDQHLTADELLSRADQALYQAKRAGSGYVVYAVPPQLVPPPDDGEMEPPQKAANSN